MRGEGPLMRAVSQKLMNLDILPYILGKHKESAGMITAMLLKHRRPGCVDAISDPVDVPGKLFFWGGGKGRFYTSLQCSQEEP